MLKYTHCWQQLRLFFTRLTSDENLVRVFVAFSRQFRNKAVDLSCAVGEQPLGLVPLHVVVGVADGHGLQKGP